MCGLTALRNLQTCYAAEIFFLNLFNSQKNRFMKKIDECDYKPDFDILDRYLNFSAELLRLSLLGISGFGALLILKYSKDNLLPFTTCVATSFFVSMLFLAVCSAFCLAHRFFASDYMSYHIKYLRTDDLMERTEGNRLLKRSGCMLIAAEVAFGLGMLVFGLAIYFLIFCQK